MSEKLGAMKCIHLNPEKDDIEKYFYKRGFHTLYTQPKFNGIRALWYYGDGLYTRNNNLITSVPHIVARLETFFPDTNLDGELYHPIMPFNDINGASRRIEPSYNSSLLEYHVFDELIGDVIQQNRLHLNASRLVELDGNHSFIKEVSFSMTTPGHLDYMLRLYLSQRFEGMVVRAPDSLYRSGRHVGNLWAIKPTYEVEAMFIGFLPPGEETSLHQGTFGSLLLKLPNGRTFSCSGLCEEERSFLWDSPPKEGAWITVKFGAWSHDDPDKAVPLFPRFKCVRWDK